MFRPLKTANRLSFLVWINSGRKEENMNKIFKIGVALLFTACFIFAGVIEGQVNDDWRLAHSQPVEILTVYIIDGEEYIVSVTDTDAIVTWEGDIPTLDIVK